MKTLLDMICPCHLVVNEGGNIQHLGPGLTKIISSDAYLHEDLFSVFHLTRPAGLATMRNVIDDMGIWGGPSRCICANSQISNCAL